MKKGIDANGGTVNVNGGVAIGKNSTLVIKGKKGNSKRLKNIEKKIDDLNLMLSKYSDEFDNINELTVTTSKVKNEIEKDDPDMKTIKGYLELMSAVVFPVTSVSNAVTALIEMINAF